MIETKMISMKLKLLPKKKMSKKRTNMNLNQMFLKILMLWLERKSRILQKLTTKNIKWKMTIYMIVSKLMNPLINI